MPNNETTLLPVLVHRHTLYVADAPQPMVPLKPICDALGLAWQVQHRKLATHPSFASTIAMMVTVAQDGKQREMVCMSTWSLPGWLMTIHPTKVAPRVQPALMAFQVEASRMLYEAWWAARNGLPMPQPGRPSGTLLEQVEGVSPALSHPAMQRAISLWEEAASVQNAGREQARRIRAAARKEAAYAGFATHELEQLVGRQRRLRQQGAAPQLPFAEG